ncbi:hypothetical protein [Variovorax paradoxus]|uniref:hypothetical protein n=1 Tax=Variovorax paradoxus TaxID=34073 RepID=UPI003ED0F2AE
MGRSYSLNGYLNAVLRRSSTTFLVEGPTDKGAMHRLLAECPQDPVQPFVIDHSALLEDEALKGLGAKVKVLRVRAKAEELIEKNPSLPGRFGCLVDREWDGITLDLPGLEENWTPPVQAENHFVTIGHSIENYHFHCECVLGYLKYSFSEFYSKALEEKIAASFDAMIALAGAVSFAAQDGACLSKFSGLICIEQIELRGADFYLSHSFISSAEKRSINQPELFVQRVNESVETHWKTLASKSHARWLLHGHIGSEVIWSCVAMICQTEGMPNDSALQVSKGFQSERRRHWLQWLAKESLEYRIPLDSATSWLQARSA